MYKNLIDRTNKQILYFIAFRFYMKGKMTVRSFSDFVSSSQNYLIIMPDDNKTIDSALEFTGQVNSGKKKVTLILRENQVSHVKAKSRLPYIALDKGAVNKVKLPSKQIINSINEKRWDIVIDLNIPENIFFSVLASMINAKYKIGFSKKNSEKFYNLIIRNNEINSEISYRNLLNSLQMF